MNNFPPSHEAFWAEERAAMAALDHLLAHGYAGHFSPQHIDSQEFIENSGDMAGPYILLEKIGEGGVGEVWRAEHTEPVHREAAVKVIKAGMDSCEIISHFEAMPLRVHFRD